MKSLTLKHGFKFEDLFESVKLKELTGIFHNYYKSKDADAFARYIAYYDAKGEGYAELETSKILIESGRFLDTFLVDFFGVDKGAEELRRSVEDNHTIIKVRSEFVTRRVLKKYKDTDIPSMNFKELDEKVQIIKDLLFRELPWKKDEEKATATMIHVILDWEQNFRNYLEIMPNGYVFDKKNSTQASDAFNKLNISARGKVLTAGLTADDYKNSAAAEHDRLVYEFIKSVVDLIQKWIFAKIHDEGQKHITHEWILFKLPLNLDYTDLVHNKEAVDGIHEKYRGTEESLRRRDGFKLTDERYNNRQVMSEVEYCVFCHERGKDSCSKGMKEKEGGFKRNPLGIPLKGCPLDEKISEMHFLKYEGRSIGALGMIMIDNPMCPGTGHRICNDCMKACIYQKQEPVNIPQIETKVLTDILNLPYGFEIYSLLTRWNPLNVKRPYELPYNGKNVLVVGMGPAGYTLSQYLLNEGFAVVGIDGLKIEKVHPDITGGKDENGNYIPPKPLKDFSSIYDELDKRVFLGFGGVSEYGITVRWDKNFLKVVYLILARRKHFKVFDGVRFGGTVEIEDAWDLGFDHIAIATGAGKPTMVSMKNNLIRGTRQASDFLMGLQLTGAAKKDTIANLMIQLPVVVVGGGLTAIDTATEAFAYYPVQVEKFYERYETTVSEYGVDTVLGMYDHDERALVKTYLGHGKAIKDERARAAAAGEKPNFVPLVRKWGGVTLCYRKSIQDSPAYRLNHEEIIKSLEEGIYYWEKLSPMEAVPDETGALKAVVMMKQIKTDDGRWKDTGDVEILPAKTLIVAAGTSPNIIYEREHPGTFVLDDNRYFFQSYKRDENGSLVKTGKESPGFFTSYNKEGRYITIYGDNHPAYAGNVVKAMASARDGYKEVAKLFKDYITDRYNPDNDKKYIDFIKNAHYQLTATVAKTNVLTPTIVEVVLKAPLQSKKFQPGQFYRLQNYEDSATTIDNVKLMMEGLALTGAWVDRENGLLGLIILEMWGSSRLCRTLDKGERVIVMGPTGAPTEIPKGETVLLAGGGLGNAVLFSVAKAMKMNGNKVIYFAGYRNSEDLFKQDEVEEATDQVIWSNDFGFPIKPRRPQDRTITANIVQAIIAYATGELEPNGNKPMFDLMHINRIVAIGSDRMMKAIKEARSGVLKDYFDPAHIAIASINSPMQCMMKEVCAQCMQRHVDVVTGKEKFVFTCFNQDQHMDEVDFDNLNARLKNNSVLEKQTKFWLDFLFAKQNRERKAREEELQKATITSA